VSKWDTWEKISNHYLKEYWKNVSKAINEGTYFPGINWQFGPLMALEDLYQNGTPDEK
jgi:hypothetical protein